MKNKCLQAVFEALLAILLTSSAWNTVPVVHAQSLQSWSDPVNVSNSGSSTDPQMVVDSEGVIHVIWVDGIDGYMYSQSVDGVTWTQPKKVGYPFDEKGVPPMLLADASGSIDVFWIDSKKSLFYASSTPSSISSPAAWQTALLAQGVANYDVASDSKGVLHIAYIRSLSSEATPAGVYYRNAGVGGRSWTKEVKLYESEYLRSATPSGSSIRIATSNVFPDEKVYVAWDSRPEKRVFMAVSENSGQKWNEAQQMKSIEDTGGAGAPFNFNVAAANDKVLIMWQAGEPGSGNCVVSSQWSQNSGTNWGNVVSVPVLGGHADCPVSSKFMIQEQDYVVAMMAGEVDPTLVAWNGEQWSAPQTQTQLPLLVNPLTHDAILFGCRSDVIREDRLYVVGCDQGAGGDIWFLSRSLEPVGNWFSPPQTWGAPATISANSETISSLASIADGKGVVHSIWVQSSTSDDGSQKANMEYARWDGTQWTVPAAVIAPTTGIPSEVSLAIDRQGRLLVSWVDGSGGLLFSWVNSDHADTASEWSKPVRLPAPTDLIDSQDILVDGSGRIVVVYAIPLNEDRGIYAVQSTDGGASWSVPIRVFDAVAAHWAKVENPKISLGRDGFLHVVFTRASLQSGQPEGIYYSRSVDGGMTWSDAQLLSEGDIRWSDIVCYSDSTVIVLWQENDGLVFANLSRVSPNGGVTWDKELEIAGVNDSPTPVTLALAGSGELHYIQLLKDSNATTVTQDAMILQDWKWNSSGWGLESSNNVVMSGDGVNYSLAADFRSGGFLDVFISAEYADLNKKIQNEILAFNTFLEGAATSKGTAAPLILPSTVSSSATAIPSIPPTQPVDLSLLNDNHVTTSSILKNIVGIILVGVAMLAAILLSVRGRNKTAKK